MLNWAVTALFAFAAAVQFNDPDPGRWLAVYGAAAGLSAAAAVRGSVPLVAPLVVGAIALAWGLGLAVGGSGLGAYASMFDAWEMKSVAIEEAREASGLFIVTVWMAFLGAHVWSVSRRSGPTGRPFGRSR